MRESKTEQNGWEGREEGYPLFFYSDFNVSSLQC